LSYTQSAVSQQIAALERETGSQLVQRGARGVKLTEAGRALVCHADAILARLAAAEAELEAIAGLRGGRLRLASFPTAGATLVPLAIAEFARRHPAVELTLREAEPEESLPLLKAGDLDVALAFEYGDVLPDSQARLLDGLDTVHLLDDPMSVALPIGHPLEQKRNLRLSDLAGERWIRCDATGICGAVTIAACERSGFYPEQAFQTNDYNVAQGLVAAGVAISLIPELAMSNTREDIVIRDLPVKERPVRHVLAATLSGGFRSPAIAAMVDVLKWAVEEYQGSRAAAACPAVSA
jgi:DNA-binding transcriptional LysR family regulator